MMILGLLIIFSSMWSETEERSCFSGYSEISVSDPSEKQKGWKQMKTKGLIVVNLLKRVFF